MTMQRSMQKIKMLCLIPALLFVQISIAQNNEDYILITPETWRSEIIPFPIDFAPGIKYAGVEELRFSPGMFDNTSETHFTYVFIWWLDGKLDINAQNLSSDLELYFKGLCSTINKDKNTEYQQDRIHADLSESKRTIISDRTDHRFFHGTVQTYDAFTDWRLLTLNFEIHSWYCEKSRKTAVFFCISPKATDRQIWELLRKINKSAKCDQE